MSYKIYAGTSQFSIDNPATRPNSLMFAVTRDKSLETAVAVINKSFGPIVVIFFTAIWYVFSCQELGEWIDTGNRTIYDDS